MGSFISSQTFPRIKAAIPILLLMFGMMSSSAVAQGPAIFSLQIGDVSRQLQGQYVEVNVTLARSVDSSLMRLDLAMAYDLEALSFAEAMPGVLTTDCGWPYFQFSFGPVIDGPDSGRCGVVRIAIASDQGNMAPGCPLTAGVYTPVVVARLRFLVTNDRAYACASLPIRFVWLDCMDNAIISNNFAVVYHAGSLHDTVGGSDIFVPAPFPSYTGSPDSCLLPEALGGMRSIDLTSGHVGLICADSIDYRGDINCNQLPMEIADYVTFCNYFVEGLAAFGGQAPCATACSDINNDGVPLGIDDLFCLAHSIDNGEYVCPYAPPVEADCTYENGIFSIADVEVAFAHIIVEGNITPTWLLARTDYWITYAYHADSNITHILALPAGYFPIPDSGFSGAFIDLGGADILSIEMITPEGTGIIGTTTDVTGDTGGGLPASYSLSSNYPNPFNASTVIRYSLPRAEDVKLTVFNVLGQAVRTLVDRREPAGRHKVEWDGLDDNGQPVASGIYFYRIAAGEFEQTRSMVLLK